MPQPRHQQGGTKKQTRHVQSRNSKAYMRHNTQRWNTQMRHTKATIQNVTVDKSKAQTDRGRASVTHKASVYHREEDGDGSTRQHVHVKTKSSCDSFAWWRCQQVDLDHKTTYSIIIMIIMIVFLGRLFVWNMLNSAEQVQIPKYKTHAYKAPKTAHVPRHPCSK